MQAQAGPRTLVGWDGGKRPRPAPREESPPERTREAGADPQTSREPKAVGAATPGQAAGDRSEGGAHRRARNGRGSSRNGGRRARSEGRRERRREVNDRLEVNY